MDRNLITDFVNGSETAFRDIYRMYHLKILRLGRHIFRNQDMAEDFTHDVFERVWNKRENFRNVESFEDYLWTMARNYGLNRRKQLLRDNVVIALYIQESERIRKGQPNNIDAHLNVRDLENMIEEALNTTTPRRKMIFRLSREKGLNSKEIAEQLGLARQTVDNEMSSALKTVKLYLQQNFVSVMLLITACFS